MQVKKPNFTKQRRSSDEPCSGEPKKDLESKTEHGYGDGPSYWDERYQRDPEPFEWLRVYREVRAFIVETITKKEDAKILHVGCGNSTLPEALYDDGFRNITNVDTSATVIAQMRARNSHRPGMTWEIMDMTDAPLLENHFDLVVDKSLLDTFACMERAAVTGARYLRTVSRVLKPGGRFVCISFGSPRSRLCYFHRRHLELAVSYEKLPVHQGQDFHYVYLADKPLVSSMADRHWPSVEKELTY